MDARGKIIVVAAVLIAVPLIIKIVAKEERPIPTSSQRVQPRQVASIDNFDFGDVVIQIAEEQNKKMPIMIDNDTRINSMKGSKTNLYYNVTLVNYTADELDNDAFVQKYRTGIVNNLCTTKEMEMYRLNNISVTSEYFDKNGQRIAVIAVRPSDCKSALQTAG